MAWIFFLIILRSVYSDEHTPHAFCEKDLLVLTNEYPPSAKKLDEIITRNNPETTGEMGANAISFIVSSRQLSGRQKAELWMLFVDRIQKQPGEKFKSYEVRVPDENYKVFVGALGHIFAIDLKNGQVYRGVTGDLNFDWEAKKPWLVPLGGPSYP